MIEIVTRSTIRFIEDKKGKKNGDEIAKIFQAGAARAINEYEDKNGAGSAFISPVVKTTGSNDVRLLFYPAMIEDESVATDCGMSIWRSVIHYQHELFPVQDKANLNGFIQRWMEVKRELKKRVTLLTRHSSSNKYAFELISSCALKTGGSNDSSEAIDAAKYWLLEQLRASITVCDPRKIPAARVMDEISVAAAEFIENALA